MELFSFAIFALFSFFSDSKEYQQRSHRKSGNLQNEDYPEGLEEEEVTDGEIPERAGENEFEEGDPIEQEAVDTTFIGSQTNVISQCPVENGAIRTTWGAISGGSVISGIAGKLMRCMRL